MSFLQRWLKLYEEPDPVPVQYDSDLPEARWDEIACLLSVPDKPEFHEMYEGEPFRALIDFRRVSTSDRFVIRLEIAIPNAPRMDTALAELDEAFVWVQTELYNVRLGTPRPEGRPTGGGLHLYINEEPQNPTQLLFVEAPAGPWRARLSMAQVGGRMAVVPYLIH